MFLSVEASAVDRPVSARQTDNDNGNGEIEGLPADDPLVDEVKSEKKLDVL